MQIIDCIQSGQFARADSYAAITSQMDDQESPERAFVFLPAAEIAALSATDWFPESPLPLSLN